MNRAKIFKNGDSQAIRLPKEFRFKGKEVYIRKEGNNVIISPIDDAVDRLWKTINSFSDDFTLERDQPEILERVKDIFKFA
jgi:antitoxin VapB